MSRWGSLWGFLTQAQSKAPTSLRELRVQSHGHAVRVFYAFDPQRDAIVLIGGDKTGISADRFYREYIPKAERILREYLTEIEEEDDG